MTNKSVITICFCFLVSMSFAQFELDLRFSTYAYFDDAPEKGKFRILASERVVIVERYSTTTNKPTIRSMSATPVKSVTVNADSTEFIFKTTKDIYKCFLNGTQEYECTKVYDDGVIGQHYYGETAFEVLPVELKRSAQGPCPVLFNAEKEYLVKGEKNVVKYSAYRNQTHHLTLATNNGRVEDKFGSAEVYVDNNRPTTLYIFLKGDTVPLYSKTFKVIEKGAKLPIKSAAEVQNDCAEILRSDACTLFAAEENDVMITFADYYAKNTDFTVQGGELISFSNGVLKIKPDNEKHVIVTCTKKANNLVLFTIPFQVKKRHTQR